MTDKLTKGQRKQARDDWHLRWNQALKHTRLDSVYQAAFRFELTTDKATHETRFTATGTARIQDIPQKFTIIGYPTGEQKNGRACFRIDDLTYRLGSGAEMQIDTDADDMPKLVGDLFEIGPAIINRIFESLHAQLPLAERTREEQQADRRACDDVLKKLVNDAARKCRHKNTAFQFAEAFRFFGDARHDQPYYAKAVFKINDQHSDVRFKFKRIGLTLEFVLESVWVDQRNPKINFRVSPFTVENAIVTGMRNAIKWIKEGFKMDSTAIEKDPATEQAAAKKTPATKKPAAKKSPAKKPAVEKPDFKQLSDARMGQVKKTAKVIENGELKSAPKPAVKVVKKPAPKVTLSGGLPVDQLQPIESSATSANKSQVKGVKLDAIDKQIIGIVSECSRTPLDKITLETVLADIHLNADSVDAEIDVLEMTMQLEEEFEIEIPDTIEHEWKTVGDISKYIREKQAEAAAPKSETKARRASKAKVEAATGTKPRTTGTKPQAKGKPGPVVKPAPKAAPQPTVAKPKVAKPKVGEWDAIDQAELTRLNKQLAEITSRVGLLQRAKANNVSAAIQLTADVKAKAKDDKLILEIKEAANIAGFQVFKAKKLADFADKYTLRRTFPNGTKVAVVIQHDDSSKHRFIMATDETLRGQKESTHTLPVELKTKAQLLAVLRKFNVRHSQK